MKKSESEEAGVRILLLSYQQGNHIDLRIFPSDSPEAKNKRGAYIDAALLPSLISALATLPSSKNKKIEKG